MREKPKPPGYPFKKGESGNPGGRPKVVADIRALAQEHSAAAVAELARLSTEAERDETRLRAIELLLDRAYGKPALAESQPPEAATINVIRVPMPAQSAESWQAECDAWRARQDALKANGNGRVENGPS